MLKHSIRIALLAALLQLAPSWASVQGNDACQALVAEGYALQAQGKGREAWESFQRARKADPAASMPVAAMANMLAQAAEHAPADQVAGLNQQAESLAHDALRIDSQDPLAQETLRILLDGGTPLHTPNADAARAMNEGEALFQQQRFAEALAKYELAAERDPLYSEAWVMAGDCFYGRKEWGEAARRFRKATEIAPLNAQAWRFLSDALFQQGDHEGALAALLNGIGAQPSQLPNWDKLDAMMKMEGTPLKRLALERKARAKRDPATGKTSIEISAAPGKDSTDFSVWLLLAMSESSQENAAAAAPATPFRKEVMAWQTALLVAAESEQSGKSKLTEPALLTMQKLAHDQQLEAAILLLMYRESYRADFEAWKRAHPDGIKAFVATYGLRP